ncbi:receptor expression-enhancing protein 4 isoform X1 [Monodon monoceros]|uniref:receptor expression-enhancing protein 4 isoform X1 n=1 Tax=Monodon monoceros TaxID=40151 RepID=UPI0010F85B96|nr:receptor expression-enhancing protein 4 isoform X1 [Monodon monoceros]
MGHSCRPGQAWDVCKQQGGKVASRALTQVQVVQAKREEQGRHCHLERGVRGRPPPGRGVGSGAPHTLPLLWGLLFRLVFGMLYPTYASYKAVKTKNIREYVRWMMYWIVFALFMAVETFTDIFISWFPFYYEIKMAFVLWLLSPYTKGASLLYRKFVHPSLSRHEKEIDTYIVQAKERSYETVLSFGKRGLNIAASAAVQAATKSQGALAGRLRSFSMQDLRTISDAPAPTYQDPLYLEDQVPHRRPPIGYRSGGLQDSDTEDECWSDTEVVPQPSARPREKPLGRTQSLRVVKRKPLVREGTSRSLKVRTRKKTTPSDMDS